VNAIRDHAPRTRITWVVEPMPSAMVSGHPAVDAVVVYDRKNGLRGLAKLRRDLAAAGPFDVTLNLNVYLKSVWPTLLSRAPRRIGFDRARSFDGVWLASNEHLRRAPRAHNVDMFLEFAAHLGIPLGVPEWRVVADRDADGAVPGKPVATVIPVSASHKKDWTPAGWAVVVRSLVENFGFHVKLAGGPGERDARIGREIESLCRVPVEWAMGDSVRRMTSIIASSALVLAPDTGPVHIARAVGTPVIGIYGHTNPWRVGPWQAYQDLWVDHYTEGVPDPSRFEPKWNVMPGIRPEEVIDKIRVAVEKYRVRD
jgi:heptosyltransferase I